MLAVAKAMRASGHRPKSTVVFLATAAEEFGWTNSYYDWLAGAWWAVTRAHPDWPGKVRGMINFESMALKGTALSVRTMPELEPWLKRLAARNADLLPDGFEIILPVSCWNDQWPFTASGVPSMKFDTTDEAYDRLYHSNRETAALVDAGHLARLAKLAFRMAGELDRGLLPYSLKAKADDIAAAVKPDELRAAGADPAALFPGCPRPSRTSQPPRPPLKPRPYRSPPPGSRTRTGPSSRSRRTLNAGLTVFRPRTTTPRSIRISRFSGRSRV